MNEQDLLERLVVNNPDLEKLEELLGDFNAFVVLGIHHHEIRHSNVLAWLLDPSGTHGLGDYFLKQFLSQASSIARSLEIPTVTPVDIDVWDLSDTLVRREEDRLDISLVNESQQFVCVIENKVLSGEHSQQLSRYRSLVERTYPGFIRLYVLLSPEGTCKR